jgi:hypothetical protein
VNSANNLANLREPNCTVGSGKRLRVGRCSCMVGVVQCNCLCVQKVLTTSHHTQGAPSMLVQGGPQHHAQRGTRKQGGLGGVQGVFWLMLID